MSPPLHPPELQVSSTDSLEVALAGLDIGIQVGDIISAVSEEEDAKRIKQIAQATDRHTTPSKGNSPISIARSPSFTASNPLVSLPPSDQDAVKPPSLLPDIFDLILDHLCDEPTSLKACCLVSKSWVPRARRHLFAYVYLGSVTSWEKHFPDPSSSPAHFTRSLGIYGPPVVTAARAWIRSFCHAIELEVDTTQDTDGRLSLVHLCGFSPTLKSLHLYCTPTPLPEIFDLICSFPLLEDLTLDYDNLRSNVNEWSAPSTSPVLSGSLDLSCENCTVVRGLLGLPSGLHFSKIKISRVVEDAESTMDLVSKCSDTLESLCVEYFPLRRSRSVSHD
jgi:hypothetical protein